LVGENTELDMDGGRAVPRGRGALRALVCDNRLIDSLEPRDRVALAAHLETVTLAARQVLFEPGQEVTHVHFPCAGTVVSLTATMADGRAAEVAAIGCEGAAGGIISGGDKPAFTRAVVQIGGPALRIDAGALDAARAASPTLRDLLARYADVLLAQALQSVACNALHPVEARASRWLLMLHDRVDGDEVPLTQEFLAEMLGVQRTTVTRVLAGFARAGMLAQRRGGVLVADRPALERSACECYAVVQEHARRVLPALASPRRRA
jgi:CRP-like cAMP-binding protein